MSVIDVTRRKKASKPRTEIPIDCQADRVVSLDEAAAIAGVSIATLRRAIARGEGPIVTWLSPRRCGIRTKHLREWLDQCAGAA